MTVGVGVVCQRGTCVVMATDTKGSFAGDLFPSHNRLSKQLALPFRLCGSIAGDVDTCNAVENRLFDHLRCYPANLPVILAHVLGSVEKEKCEEFLRRVNDKMLALLGMTLGEWQRLPSKDSRYRRGARLMKQYAFLSAFLPVPLFFTTVGFTEPTRLAPHFLGDEPQSFAIRTRRAQ